MTAKQTFGQFVALAVSAALIIATVLAINVRLTEAAYEVEDSGPQVESDEIDNAPLLDEEAEEYGSHAESDEIDNAALLDEEAEEYGSHAERDEIDNVPLPDEEVEEQFEAPAPCSDYTLARVEIPQTDGVAPCASNDDLTKQFAPWGGEIAEEEVYEGDCFKVELVHFEAPQVAEETGACETTEFSA